MMKEYVTITLEEYKKLLEINGKYEELKEHPEIKYIYVYVPSTPSNPWKPNEPFYYDPYKITCNVTNPTKINLDDDKNTDDFYKNVMGIDKTE